MDILNEESSLSEENDLQSNFEEKFIPNLTASFDDFNNLLVEWDRPDKTDEPLNYFVVTVNKKSFLLSDDGRNFFKYQVSTSLLKFV